MGKYQKIKHPGILGLVFLLLVFISVTPAFSEGPTWFVYFSPGGGCTQAIIKELDGAKKEVLVQAYSFSSAPIAKALLNAHKRMVQVQVILDKSQVTQKILFCDLFPQYGHSPLDRPRPCNRSYKVMIIDREMVITGSFNFTKAAEEKNAENLLIIRDKELARRYLENWQEHAGHSEPYAGK